MDQLVTVEEAARALACTPAAVRKWISQKRLPRVKVGRLTRLRARDVAAVVSHGLPDTPGRQSLQSVADTPTLPPCNSDSATGGSGGDTRRGN